MKKQTFRHPHLPPLLRFGRKHVKVHRFFTNFRNLIEPQSPCVHLFSTLEGTTVQVTVSI